MASSNKCVECGCSVVQERVDFLVENNKEITCLAHGSTARIKAIYSGEHGTSDLIFCDKVYNDSVRSKLYRTEEIEAEEDEDIEAEEPKEHNDE